MMGGIWMLTEQERMNNAFLELSGMEAKFSQAGKVVEMEREHGNI
jgi:hypothetical protein